MISIQYNYRYILETEVGGSNVMVCILTSDCSHNRLQVDIIGGILTHGLVQEGWGRILHNYVGGMFLLYSLTSNHRQRKPEDSKILQMRPVGSAVRW